MMAAVVIALLIKKLQINPEKNNNYNKLRTSTRFEMSTENRKL